MPEHIFKTKKALNASLIAATGIESGGVIEWTVNNAGSLTDAEKIALKKKHRSHNPNYRRAEKVKNLIRGGLTCKEIVLKLRREYGERQIKADHAALAPLFGRGGARK